jgi:hypothetical protein
MGMVALDQCRAERPAQHVLDLGSRRTAEGHRRLLAPQHQNQFADGAGAQARKGARGIRSSGTDGTGASFM